MLVKNRDYRLDHQDLQCVAFAKPTRGFSYAYVTSAGSPGVFSSGMNEAGLAVADTHVNSLDLGPGLARYSLMMDVLEQYDQVSSALDYLQTVPHTGDGTLILLDKTGDMAVFEISHKTQGIIKPTGSYLVSTNHFTSPHLSEKWEDRSRPELRGNSEGRYASISAGLRNTDELAGVAWAQKLMSDHGGPNDAICRHPGLDPASMTISSVLYLPQTRRFYLANGNPCQVDIFTLYSI
jgi:hypothetical protein